MVRVTPVAIPTSSVLLGAYSKARVIATGENSIILYAEGAHLIKIDISKNMVTYSSAIRDLAGGGSGPLYSPNVTKGGKIRAMFFYVKMTEPRGSRYLYEREVTIDPTTLSVDFGPERQYTNNVIHNWVPTWASPIRLSENQILTTNADSEKCIIIDMYAKRTTLLPSWGVSGYLNVPHGIIVDRAVNSSAIITGQHYWIPGSYANIILANPRDFSQVSLVQSFDSGSGMFGWRKYYIDSQGIVRLIMYGASSGYTLPSASKWHAFYLNNGTLTAEFVVTAGSAYNTSSTANRHPYILGIRTSDNRILLATYAHPWNNSSTWGVAVVDVDDKLQNPANMVEAQLPVSTSEQAGYINNPTVAFIDENTYDILIYGGVITYNGTPTLFLFRISDLPDMNYDPFNLVPIPKSGLIPTRLMLDVAPL